jgi:periplasmic protein TonB
VEILLGYNLSRQSLTNQFSLARGAKKGKYLVSVQFVVDKAGSISDVKALTSNGYGMEAEVLLAIKKKTKWLPSSQGVPVRPYRTSSSTPPVSN